jgi:hypothetical protein
VTTASALFAAARGQLEGVPAEGLGQEKRSRWRGERIVRVGSARHVGVLLIADDAVHAVGEVLRAGDPGRRGYAADSARYRAARRLMALRGGFREGEVVHVGWVPLDLEAVDAGGASGPLALRDGIPSVQWAPAGGYQPLEAYLAERIALLRG